MVAAAEASAPGETTTIRNTEIIEAALPQELVIPDRKGALALMPELTDQIAELDKKAVTLEGILPKLEDILSEVKRLGGTSALDATDTTGVLKGRLPAYPNSADVNCGLLATDPVVTLSYTPKKSYVPFLQWPHPATLSATLKSFDGKRDIKFSDFIFTRPDKLDTDHQVTNPALEGIVGWINAITNVVERESLSRAKHLGYDAGNEHFKSQLLGIVAQLINLPQLEFTYRSKLQDLLSKDEKRAELTQQAYAAALEALEDARKSAEAFVSKVYSGDVEAARDRYLNDLKGRFDTALSKVKPAAQKEAEAKLAKINEEIAKREAQLNPSPESSSAIQITASLFEFIDGAVKSHSHWGPDCHITTQHKMGWARQLCTVLQGPSKGLGLAELTMVLRGILKATWMYKDHPASGKKYVERKDINKCIKLAGRVYQALDMESVASVSKILTQLGQSETVISTENIEESLTTLVGLSK